MIPGPYLEGEMVFMPAALVAAGYHGAFKGLRSPSKTLQTQKWLCELLSLLSPRGRSHEPGTRAGRPPAHVACPKASAEPLHFSVPQFPPSVKWGGNVPTSQGCCEV